MTPLIRNPITRARLEGVVIGMLLAVAAIWLADLVPLAIWSQPS